MSFLYPRRAVISRQNRNTTPGAQPYSGVKKANETVIAGGIPAHIQADRQGTAPVAGLAADAAGQSIWKVIVKVPLGQVLERDIITDDLGKRYQVISADWGPLVTTCRCQLLET
ncbi:MAG: hypothetical protein U0835_00180 [Isosphaeraceae bacterium]